MEKTLLTEPQIRILELVVKHSELSDFYLTGGTALSQYYFKHRVSDDLDFFTFKEPEMMYIHAFVEHAKKEIKAKDVRFSKLYDRNQFFFIFDDNELKIEFTKYPFKQLDAPIVLNNLKIDSLKDISANKLMAMLDRFDPKDFVDLFFILKEVKLEDIRLDTEKKFEVKIDTIFLGSELLKTKRIVTLPRMVRPLNVDELKNFFEDLAKSLSSSIIA